MNLDCGLDSVYHMHLYPRTAVPFYWVLPQSGPKGARTGGGVSSYATVSFSVLYNLVPSHRTGDLRVWRVSHVNVP